MLLCLPTLFEFTYAKYKQGKNIVPVEGKAFSEEGKLAATVLYTVILKSLVQ